MEKETKKKRERIIVKKGEATWESSRKALYRMMWLKYEKKID